MNRTTIVRISLALLAASAAGIGVAGEKPKDFAFGVPLTMDTESAFYRATLPATFYTGSGRADQGDLRVFNGDGASVPYARLEPPVPSRERRVSVRMAFFPLRVDEQSADLSGLSLTVNRNTMGNTSVSLTTRDGQPVAGQRLAGYLVDAGDSRDPIAAIVLELPKKVGGTNTRVRIESSDDLNLWRTIIGDAPLLDLEYEGRRLQRNKIELRQPPARYLRISWAATQAPVQLDGVSAELGERIVEVPRQWSEAVGSAVADKEYEFQFDLGGALPADRIAIDLPEINTVAPARLAARMSADEPWHDVTALVTYRLRQDGGEVSAPPTAVPPAAYRYWLLRVDPKSGGLGRGQPRMRAGWIPQDIVFAARGTGPFVIAYGNATAAPSALPVVTLIPGYSSAQESLGAIPVARVGPSSPLGDLDQARPPREYRRAGLWGILILGVAVLGWMAWQLSRQLNAAASSAEPAAPAQLDPDPPDTADRRA